MSLSFNFRIGVQYLTGVIMTIYIPEIKDLQYFSWVEHSIENYRIEIHTSPVAHD
jgi:hypothetical protein